MTGGPQAEGHARRRRRKWACMITASLAVLIVIGVIPIEEHASELTKAGRAAVLSATYFQTLPPGAALPDGSQCAAQIPATPETIPANTPFNHTTVTPAQLAAFAANGYSFEGLSSKAQYRRITGDYTGST